MILAARELAVAYDAREILHGVTLGARAGELLAIVGPNGAGKTTLLRALAGTVAPSRGAVLLGETPLHTLSRVEIARAIAVVPQDVPSAAGFTVREVVALGRAPHQGAWLRERAEDRDAVDAALGRCAVKALADRPFDALSGGERKRALLAQALCQSARVLLLDEPSAFLDVGHAVALFELAREEVRRGVAVVAIVHDLSLAARFGDRVAILRDGSLVCEGAPAEVLVDERLSELFAVPIRRLRGEDGTFAFAPAPRAR